MHMKPLLCGLAGWLLSATVSSAQVGAGGGGCVPNVTVVNANDSGPGSLRQALVDVCSGGTINFATTVVTQSIELTGGELVVAKDVIIAGPGATRLSVSAQNASRVFFVASNSPPYQVTIADLTVERGNGVGENFTRIGGGIFNHQGSLTLSNCILTGHSASGNSGGAVFNNRGSLTALNCTLHANSAAFGGAIYNSAGALTIRNCTLAANTAVQSGGAVMHNGGTLTLANSTVSGNSAGTAGGGIYDNSATPIAVRNSIVAGNSGGAGTPDIRSLENALASNGYNFIGTTNGIANAAGLTDKTFANTGTTLPQLLQTSAGVPVLSSNSIFFIAPTIGLVAGSPALNAGEPGFNDPALPTDQRGMVYSRVADGRLDIGAYENQVPLALCASQFVLREFGGVCLLDTPARSFDQGSFDYDGDALAFVVDPPGPYPIGRTSVTFWVIDSKGASNSCQTAAIVSDRAAPTIQCPPDDRRFYVPPGSNTALVTFSVTANDSCDSNVVISCQPPSGSYLMVGTAFVNCSARDTANNFSFCQFVVQIWPSPMQITTFERPATNQFRLRFNAASGPNVRYGVESSEDLGSWNFLGIADPTTSGQFEYLDTNAPSGHRFYRVTYPP